MKLLFAFATALLWIIFYIPVIAQSAKDFHAFGWNTYGQFSGEAFDVFRNEASIANTPHFTAGIIAEEKFILQETASFAFTAALSTSSGSFGISGRSFGFESFRQIQTAFIYGRRLTDWLDAGAAFNYLHSSVPGYGNAHAVTFGIGTIIHWNRQWHTGLQAFNPANVKFSGLGDDVIPSVYRFGVGYQPSDIFLLSAEISKTGEFPVEGTAAFHYHIVQSLSITVGAGTGENNLFLGFTIYLKQVRILAAASHHSRLGLTPATGFIFQNK
ncbi:MAG: hypothetical protein EPN37_18225 [Chitinophagaceae bacterium]|nr:MAG: hypothetical protein EPN37_18225 [Chitinophagaceae bacterium]